MEFFPVKKWYRVIPERHSRRRYLERGLNNDDLKSLKDFITQLNEQVEGFKVALVLENVDRIFKGLIGSYGSIKGAPACAVFLADEGDPHGYEKVGYYGEAFILEATSRGLGTCWVGATFDQKLIEETVKPTPSEKVMAVTPVGYTEKQYTLEEKLVSMAVSGHKRKPLEKLCAGGVQPEWPGWVKDALQCARLAPSALNRQPWRFRVKDNSIIVSAVDNGKEDSNKLNCGIAMLHLEIGALYNGIQGEWKYGNYPQIAEYVFAR